MKIDKNQVITLTYHLFVATKEEEVSFEKTTAEEPLVFIYGMGQLLADFEKNILGKSTGDTFDFYLEPEQAYGIFQEEHIIDLPVDIFFTEDGQLDSSLSVGKRVPMVDDQGNRLVGTILKMGLETIRMDFNHPLAGQRLRFQGDILDVRAASPEEIEHRHVHGPGGHHH